MGTSSGPQKPTLTVFSRLYCHLCDDLIAGLRTLQARFSFEIEVVDVDADPELDERYGAEVPVLEHAGMELCRHRLDAGRVADYLARIG